MSDGYMDYEHAAVEGVGAPEQTTAPAAPAPAQAGGQPDTGMTPAQAEAEIQRLSADKSFRENLLYNAINPAGRHAKETWDRLHSIAYAGGQSVDTTAPPADVAADPTVPTEPTEYRSVNLPSGAVVEGAERGAVQLMQAAYSELGLSQSEAHTFGQLLENRHHRNIAGMDPDRYAQEQAFIHKALAREWGVDEAAARQRIDEAMEHVAKHAPTAAAFFKATHLHHDAHVIRTLVKKARGQR